MKNIIEYKDYLGSVEYNANKESFLGKILGIRGIFPYKGESAKELRESFIQAVEDYLETCSLMKRKPEKSCKGSFNIRIDSDLHRLAFVLSNEKNMSLNNFVKEAIKEKIQNEQKIKIA